MTSYDPPQPVVSAQPDRLSAGSMRRLSVPIAEVRAPLLPAVRALDFALTTEQFSLIEAERGSRFGGLTLTPSRVPVVLRIDLDPDGEGTRLAVRLEDRWKIPIGRNWGAVSVYTQVFTEALTALDAVLARLDPAAAATFEPWWRNVGDGDVAAMQNAGNAAARAEQAVSRKASKLLDGPQSPQSRSAMADAGLSMFTFATADQVAELPADDVDGILTAGQLVAGRPGALPPKLVGQVQQFVVTLEGQLESGRDRGYGTPTRLVITDAQVPVVSFLYQQAKLREQLPMRIVMVCTTCRLEKVVNPDFTRMRERSRRLKALSGSVGLVFGSHQVSPYILVGKLVQLKKTDPDFVCQRCQGLDADQSMITFCPRCGQRRGETVLRTCPNCDFDFRGLIKVTPVWKEPAALAAPTPIALAPVVPAVPAAAQPEPRSAPPVAEAGVAPGWYPDPYRRFEFRYWDGRLWTQHVSRSGVASVDAPTI